MARQATTTSVGDALERRVAAYYEALGFQVTRDVKLLGHQIDLLVRRYIPGASTVTIAVEVKHRRRTLGINEVTPFINTAKHLIHEMKVSGAVLVTNARISSEVKPAVADLENIRVIQLTQLEQDVFNNSESLLRVIRDHEHQNVFSSYYPLRARDESTEYSDITSYLLGWASDSNGLALLIGDFGSGKSTILDRVFYEMAKRRLTDGEALFPVMLKLRTLRQHSELWHFVETSLRDNQYLVPPRAVFESELKLGRLLLLLDGFDEIQTGATAVERAEFLNALRPLIVSKSPAVLSSRPTFFDSMGEMVAAARQVLGAPDFIERMPEFGVDRAKWHEIFPDDAQSPIRAADLAHVLTLAQLDDSQVTAAIRKREGQLRAATGMPANEFKRYLYSIYDLKDLMRRPLLLDMVLTTVARGAIDVKSRRTVGPSTLYDLYTQEAALRDKRKRILGQLLDKSQRLAACRFIALAMLRKGEIVLTGTEVAACVMEMLESEARTRSKKVQVSDVERAVTDVRICSFLRFSDDGSLRFTHTSFFEFFVAQAIYLASTKGRSAFLRYSRQSLSREICYFLASYARDQGAFTSFIKLSLRQNLTGADRSFVHRIAFAAGTVLNDYLLSGSTIKDAELRKADIERTSFSRVTIEKCSVRDSEIRELRMDDTRTIDVGFFNNVISNGIMRLNARSTEFVDCRFYGTILDANGSGIRFDTCQFEDCAIGLDIQADLLGVECTNSEFRLKKSYRAKAFAKCVFDECDMYREADGRWYNSASNVGLYRSLIAGLWFDGSDLIADFRLGARGRIRISDCRGIAVVSLSPEIARSEAYHSLRAANPRLLFVDAQVLASLDVPAVEDAERPRAKRSTQTGAMLKEIASAARDAARMVNECHIKEGLLPPALRVLLGKSRAVE